jgi:PKD repeat protein
MPSGGWSSDGTKSVYIYVGFNPGYRSSYYGQYAQSITLPAGQYMLIFDCYGSSITSGYGYMSMIIGGVEKYRKMSGGVQYFQQSDSFLSTGTPMTITLRNGVSSGSITRYGSGYWDNLIVHTYSATPPSASEFSGELAFSNDVISYPGHDTKPTDPDADGLYEDVNGNGRLDFQDIMIFFQYNAWAQANQPNVSCFDWSGNGAIEFSDVQKFWESEFT